MLLRFSSAPVLATCFIAIVLLKAALFSRSERLPQQAPDTGELSQSLLWEKRIVTFEMSEKREPAPTDGILFVGSSSIERWQTLNSDFETLPVIGRGCSGSTLAETVPYVKRVVVPCRPRIIVLYSGSNDIAEGMKPRAVLESLKRFVAEVRAELPATRMLYISNAPNPCRWALVDQIREANALIADYCVSTNEAEYIDVFTAMLGADGAPRAELFVEDRLHMNEHGYALWKKLLDPHLRPTSLVNR
jgi:lysophospholipase L1-like esterase